MGIDVTAFGLPILYCRHSIGKEKGERISLEKSMGCRVFYNVNRIGTSKVVTFIPILQGHYIDSYICQPQKGNFCRQTPFKIYV